MLIILSATIFSFFSPSYFSDYHVFLKLMEITGKCVDKSFSYLTLYTKVLQLGYLLVV